MIMPSLAAWTITTFWVQYVWIKAREEKAANRLITNCQKTKPNMWSCLCFDDSKVGNENTSSIGDIAEEDIALAMLSPRSKAKHEEAQGGLANKLASYIVSSPFPFAMLTLMLLMIILIFCELMSIAGLVCVTAMMMVIHQYTITQNKKITSEYASCAAVLCSGSVHRVWEPVDRQDYLDQLKPQQIRSSEKRRREKREYE